MAVDPVTSVKTTVTVLRTSRGVEGGSELRSSALLALQDAQVGIGPV